MWEKYKVDIPEGISGDFEVSKFNVDPGDVRSLGYALHGRPVPPGTYTRLTHNGDVIMSDTPSEILDHLNFIKIVRGRVLINGLGLGVVIKGLLMKLEVHHIDVVEKEYDVIKLVWPTYKYDPRLSLYHADAFTVQWEKDILWDFVWHDIWPDICTDNLPEISKLKRKYVRRTGWQGAWCEKELRGMKRKYKTNSLF